MCGIFGIIGDYDVNDFKILSVLNESRGTDSFGCYDGKKIYKTLFRPRDSFEIEKMNVQSTFVFGHTRNASVSSPKKKENAHPFRIGSIVGAHNGSVYNFEYLRKKYEADAPKMEVDSEIIFWGLNHKGFEVFKEISGDWAIVWHDMRAPNYLWLGSHKKELNIAETESAIYFSSDKKDLARIGLTGKEIPDDTILQINIETLGLKEFQIEPYTSYSYGKSSNLTREIRDYPPAGQIHHLSPIPSPEDKKVTLWRGEDCLRRERYIR